MNYVAPDDGIDSLQQGRRFIGQLLLDAAAVAEFQQAQDVAIEVDRLQLLEGHQQLLGENSLA